MENLEIFDKSGKALHIADVIYNFIKNVAEENNKDIEDVLVGVDVGFPNCTYFYGTCLAEMVDGKITVLNKKVSYEQIEELVKEQTNNLQERNQMLEAKILDWYAKSKDEKFAEHFGIKEASDGRV